MKLRLRLILCLPLTLSVISSAFAYRGEELLGVFSSSCQGQGKWSAQALSSAQALIQSLESIKDDPNCASLAASLNDLSQLESHISFLDTMSASEREALATQAKVDSIIAEMNSTTDPTYLATLQYTLSTEVSNLAYYQSLNQDFYNQKVTPASHSLSLLINGTNLMLGQLSAQKDCLLSHPQLLGSAASLVGSIAGGVSLANPLLGLSLAGGSSLLAIVIEGARKTILASKVKLSSALTTEAEAYRCVMESLSNQWCEMKDAKALLKLKANSRGQIPEKMAQGMRLLEVSMPVFFSWLGEVRAGIEASSLADSDRQSRAMDRQVMVQKAYAKGRGLINENRDLYNSYGEPSDKWRTLRQVIIAITSGGNERFFGGPNTVSDPMKEIFPDYYAPYYLVGLELSQIPMANGSPLPFEAYDPFTMTPKFSPSYLVLESRFKTWVDKASELVTKQLDLVIRPNPLLILTGYYDFTENKNKISPAQALTMFLKYTEDSYRLLSMRSEIFDQDGPFARLLLEIRNNLLKIDQAVKSATGDDKKRDPREALEIIYKAAQLEFGTGVISSQVEIPLRQILWKEISELPTEKALVSALFLSANSLESAIGTIDGSENLTAQLDDLSRGASMTMSTLESFITVFGKNIEKTLGLLLEKEKSSPKSLARDYRSMRGGICLRLLTLANLPKKFNTSLCEGADLVTVYEDGPQSPLFNQNLLQKSHEERDCVARDYLRSAKIFEDLER